MSLSEIINSIHTFIVYQPYISMGIAAALGILIYVKPKEVLKILFIFLVLGAVVYILYMIFGATESGLLNKDKMIYKSIQ